MSLRSDWANFYLAERIRSERYDDLDEWLASLPMQFRAMPGRRPLSPEEKEERQIEREEASDGRAS